MSGKRHIRVMLNEPAFPMCMVAPANGLDWEWGKTYVTLRRNGSPPQEWCPQCARAWLRMNTRALYEKFPPAVPAKKSWLRDDL